MQKYFSHKYQRMHEIYADSKYYDILYIGSSRMHHSINPRVVDSITGYKSYNAGTEGAVIGENKITLEGYLVHHKAPKLIFLSLDPWSFDLTNLLFNPIQYFDVIDNPVVYDAFKNLKDFHAIALKYLPFTKVIYFNDQFKSSIIQGYKNLNEFAAIKDATSGFIPMSYSCMDTCSSLQVNNQKVEQQGTALLQAFIDICKAKNIQLIFLYPPEYKFRWQKTFTNFDNFQGEVYKKSQDNNIDYFRDDSLSICNNRCFFADYNHLNADGANQYSTIIGNRIIKSGILKK